MKLNIEREIYIIDFDTEEVFELVEILGYEDNELTALFRCKNVKVDGYLDVSDVDVSGYADITLKAVIDFDDNELVDYSLHAVNVDRLNIIDKAELGETIDMLEIDYSRSDGFTVLDVEFKDRLCI